MGLSSRIWFATFIVGTVNDYIFMLLPVVDNFWQVRHARADVSCFHGVSGPRISDAHSTHAALHPVCLQCFYVLANSEHLSVYEAHKETIFSVFSANAKDVHSPRKVSAARVFYHARQSALAEAGLAGALDSFHVLMRLCGRLFRFSGLLAVIFYAPYDMCGARFLWCALVTFYGKQLVQFC